MGRATATVNVTINRDVGSEAVAKTASLMLFTRLDKYLYSSVLHSPSLPSMEIWTTRKCITYVKNISLINDHLLYTLVTTWCERIKTG